MKKIQYIRERSNQPWGVVKDFPRARISLLTAMNNFKFKVHPNINIKNDIDEVLRV